LTDFFNAKTKFGLSRDGIFLKKSPKSNCTKIRPLGSESKYLNRRTDMPNPTWLSAIYMNASKTEEKKKRRNKIGVKIKSGVKTGKTVQMLLILLPENINTYKPTAKIDTKLIQMLVKNLSWNETRT
jgi:hypothetical protein